MMPCTVCGDKYPGAIKSVVENGEVVDLGCDRCLGMQPKVHDVYFRHPYKSEALDVEFTSKAQKAKYLKDHNLSEAGDMELGRKSWIEGTRATRKAGFDKDRPAIREAYKRYLDNARRK